MQNGRVQYLYERPQTGSDERSLARRIGRCLPWGGWPARHARAAADRAHIEAAIEAAISRGIGPDGRAPGDFYCFSPDIEPVLRHGAALARDLGIGTMRFVGFDTGQGDGMAVLSSPGAPEILRFRGRVDAALVTDLCRRRDLRGAAVVVIEGAGEETAGAAMALLHQRAVDRTVVILSAARQDSGMFGDMPGESFDWTCHKLFEFGNDGKMFVVTRPSDRLLRTG